MGQDPEHIAILKLHFRYAEEEGGLLQLLQHAVLQQYEVVFMMCLTVYYDQNTVWRTLLSWQV